MGTAAWVYAIILALMYIPPFTVLRESSPLQLVAYWTTLGVAAVAYAWLQTRRWTQGG